MSIIVSCDKQTSGPFHLHSKNKCALSAARTSVLKVLQEQVCSKCCRNKCAQSAAGTSVLKVLQEQVCSKCCRNKCALSAARTSVLWCFRKKTCALVQARASSDTRPHQSLAARLSWSLFETLVSPLRCRPEGLNDYSPVSLLIFSLSLHCTRFERSHLCNLSSQNTATLKWHERGVLGHFSLVDSACNNGISFTHVIYYAPEYSMVTLNSGGGNVSAPVLVLPGTAWQEADGQLKATGPRPTQPMTPCVSCLKADVPPPHHLAFWRCPLAR
ncbi:hypothetical protein J6590_105635 [Homalodisca vitripennis]|nr:hypothetical protein J6590_105635 [Homalodisca vitripennis]